MDDHAKSAKIHTELLEVIENMQPIGSAVIIFTYISRKTNKKYTKNSERGALSLNFLGK